LRFCSGVIDDSDLLAYDAALMGFEASSGSHFIGPFDSVRMKAVHSFETSEAGDAATHLSRRNLLILFLLKEYVVK
jgi:hypothetical protein